MRNTKDEIQGNKEGRGYGYIPAACQEDNGVAVHAAWGELLPRVKSLDNPHKEMNPGLV